MLNCLFSNGTNFPKILENLDIFGYTNLINKLFKLNLILSLSMTSFEVGTKFELVLKTLHIGRRVLVRHRCGFFELETEELWRTRNSQIPMQTALFLRDKEKLSQFSHKNLVF